MFKSNLSINNTSFELIRILVNYIPSPAPAFDPLNVGSKIRESVTDEIKNLGEKKGFMRPKAIIKAKNASGKRIYTNPEAHISNDLKVLIKFRIVEHADFPAYRLKKSEDVYKKIFQIFYERSLMSELYNSFFFRYDMWDSFKKWTRVLTFQLFKSAIKNYDYYSTNFFLAFPSLLIDSWTNSKRIENIFHELNNSVSSESVLLALYIQAFIQTEIHLEGKNPYKGFLMKEMKITEDKIKARGMTNYIFSKRKEVGQKQNIKKEISCHS